MRVKTHCFPRSATALVNRGEPCKSPLPVLSVVPQDLCYFTVSWTVVLWARVPPTSCPLIVNVNVPWFTFWLADNVTVDMTGVPCRLSVEGETVHVELGGAPEQVRATEPAKLIGVTVMV